MPAVEQYLRPEVIRQISRLDLRAQFIVKGFLQGLHASPFHGFSVEFSEHRKYTAGDDPQDIDWLVYAKTDKYYIKKFEAETNITGYLVMDLSRSMGYTYRQNLTKFDYSICLAAALCYLMIHQQDPVGLIAFDEKIRHSLPPRSKRTQLGRVLSMLANLRPQGRTDIGKSLTQIAAMLRHRSLVMVFSDLLVDPEPVIQALHRLRHSGHDVILFHVLDEAEVHFPFDGMVEFEDPETLDKLQIDASGFRPDYLAEVRAFCERYRRECFQSGIDYVGLDTSMQFDRALTGYLASRRGRYSHQMWQLSFLNSAFLWGALAVGVPLALHLMMRRQPRHLEFPALRFIKLRESANRRQLKLRHLVLLALRMAFIVLLAAALARPSLQGSGLLGDQEAPVAAALVFDTSPRMEYRWHNETRLESARETGLWLVSQLPRESEVSVLESRYGYDAHAGDLLAAKDSIQVLKSSAAGSPLAASFGDALKLLRDSGKQRKEIYVFTDLTKTCWSPQATQSLRKQLGEQADVGVYLIDVGVDKPQNAGIVDLHLSSEVVSKGVELVIEADLVHSGGPAERTAELYLLDETQTPVIQGSMAVKFEDAAQAQAEFRRRLLDTGIHQGYVKIAGEDALAADDTRWFTIDVTPAWKVLLASPQPTENYSLFLSEAIAPNALRLKGAEAFHCDTVSLDNLLKKPLSEYNVVCLLDPKPLAEDVWRQLADYAAAGGGVAIFLGRNAQPVDSFNQEAAQRLLPGKLLRESRQETYLAPEHIEHPLLAKFRPLESSIPWDAFPVYKHWLLGPLHSGAGVVIPYANTEPALVEQPLPRGRVLTMTTPVSDASSQRDPWNMLPTGEEPWPFVMLASEMMHYLAGSTHSKLNYLAGDTAVIRLAADQHHSSFSLIPPSGNPMRQNVDERESAKTITVSGTDQTGNYRLSAGGAADGTHLGFSVNLPSDVSRLERVTPDELKAVFGDTPFRVARSRDEIVRDVNFGRVGRELYPLLIVLVVLVLAAEQLLANRFYRPGNQRERSAAASFVREREDSRQSAAQKAAGSPPSLPTASASGAAAPDTDAAKPQTAGAP